MLAMPISGTGSKKKGPKAPPVITFIGPNESGSVKAINNGGAEVASFTVDGSKSSFTIVRNMPNAAPVTICTGGKSSLSSNTSMTVHGQEVQNKYNTHLELPGGNFKWRYGDGGMSDRRKELVDSSGQMVAYADLDQRRFDVFVAGDEMFLDFLLAGWVSFVKSKETSASDTKQAKALVTGFKIIGALAGGGGA